MFMGPGQQYAGLYHTVWELQQEVTMPKASFKSTLPEKSGVDGGAIKCQHILVSCFTCTPNGDLLSVVMVHLILFMTSAKGLRTTVLSILSKLNFQKFKMPKMSLKGSPLKITPNFCNFWKDQIICGRKCDQMLQNCKTLTCFWGLI